MKPTNLFIEDYVSQPFGELTILYAFGYSNGTSDAELREHQTSLTDLEHYYNSLGWNSSESFTSWWETESYKNRLDFLFLFVADPKNGFIQTIVKSLIAEIMQLSIAS